jgi:ketosteroid isomerase-like protein
MEQLEAAYQAWHDSKGQSRDAWLALASERIQLRSVNQEGGGLSFARARHSRDDFLDYMTSLNAEWEMVYFSPKTFVRERNRVAMFGTSKWINKATRRPCEVMMAHLWRFRDGKAIELVEVFDSARAVTAATPDA